VNRALLTSIIVYSSSSLANQATDETADRPADRQIQRHKPVVDVARDAQCCVHTRDSLQAVADRHTYGQMDEQTLCDNKG